MSHVLYKDKKKPNTIRSVVLRWNNPFPFPNKEIYTHPEDVMNLDKFADLGIWDLLKKYAKKKKIKYEKP